MPHKHKRDQSKNGPSYNLPPTSLAHPLPVTKAPQSAPTSKPAKPRPGKRKSKPKTADDTPRAFTRLMNYTITGRKLPSGLDDGVRSSKKRKRPASGPSSTPTHPTTIAPDLPKIQPNEPLSSFSARVNAALPVSGLASKRNIRIEGEKPRRTKMEKKMKKMQREWREEERRIKEAREDASDEESDGGIAEVAKGGKKSKKRKGGAITEDDDDWAAITSKRLSTSTMQASASSRDNGLVGIHDVVLAPPKLAKVREKMKAPGGTGVQGAVGGLKRQGELSEARMKVVEGYRVLMRERRSDEGAVVS